MNQAIPKAAGKLFLFVLPFLLLGGAVVYIDPFEYFALPCGMPAELKHRIAYRLNYALWKTVHYKHQPVSDIILGDSRVDQFGDAVIRKYTPHEYFNFGYGGGSLPEVISTFWFASEQIPLQRVYIGINLNLYNEYLSRNRVTGALSMLGNPLLYLVNRDVWKASRLIVSDAWFGRHTEIEKPPLDREAFWRYQLTVTADRYYRLYRHPAAYFEDLKKIAEYCRERDIELTFVILPSHADLQRKTAGEYGLASAETRMRDDLRSLGRVLDFDWLNELTENRENFRDPFHLQPAALDRVAQEIWGVTNRYGRILN